jgi:hypothetical protein
MERRGGRNVTQSCIQKTVVHIRRLTIKFANSPLCAYRGNTEQILSMVWWRWHISILHVCCCWSMAVSFWVASIIVCVCFGVPPRECRRLNFPRSFGEARWQFRPCHHRWWIVGIPIQSWNEAVKCTMVDCQFPKTKNNPSIQIKSQNNFADIFYITGIVVYEFISTGHRVN